MEPLDDGPHVLDHLAPVRRTGHTLAGFQLELVRSHPAGVGAFRGMYEVADLDPSGLGAYVPVLDALVPVLTFEVGVALYA